MLKIKLATKKTISTLAQQKYLITLDFDNLESFVIKAVYEKLENTSYIYSHITDIKNLHISKYDDLLELYNQYLLFKYMSIDEKSLVQALMLKNRYDFMKACKDISKFKLKPKVVAYYEFDFDKFIEKQLLK